LIVPACIGGLCAIFFLGLIGWWDPRLAQHMMAVLDHSQQSRWREGLTNYIVVPT